MYTFFRFQRQKQDKIVQIVNYFMFYSIFWAKIIQTLKYLLYLCGRKSKKGKIIQKTFNSYNQLFNHFYLCLSFNFSERRQRHLPLRL